MSNIYVTSDTHFAHSKNFLYEPRGFKNIYDHDNTIIKNWNKIVQPEDEVYLLGDVMLNDNDYGLSCLKQLNGRIHIIRGNHCTDARIALYKTCPNVVAAGEYATIIKYGKYHFYLSHFPTITSNYNEDDKITSKLWNLAGHSHYKNRFKDMDKGCIYHVELDAHNNFPISIDYIIEDIKAFYQLDEKDQLDIIKKQVY